MVARIKSLRALLAGRLGARRPDRDFGWLTQQRGMFSLLGLAPAGVAALAGEEHVYTPPDGRINLAGVSDANVDRVADAIVRVLDRA
jgi:aspartate/tyrosine/aromatic aminotransferase